MHATVPTPFDVLECVFFVLECLLALPLLVLSVKVARVPVEVLLFQDLKCLTDHISVAQRRKKDRMNRLLLGSTGIR